MSRKIGLISDIQDLGGFDDNLKGLEHILSDLKSKNLDAISCAGDIADKHAIGKDLSFRFLRQKLLEEKEGKILEVQEIEEEKLKNLEEELNIKERQKKIIEKYPNGEEELLGLYSKGVLPKEDKQFIEDVFKYQQAFQTSQKKINDLTKGITSDMLDYATINFYNRVGNLFEELNMPVYTILGNNDTSNAYESFEKSKNIITTKTEFFDEKTGHYLVNRPSELANEKDDRLCIENYKPKKIGTEYKPTFITTHEPILEGRGYAKLDKQEDGLEKYIEEYNGEEPLIVHHGHAKSAGLTLYKNQKGGIIYFINTNNSGTKGLTYGDLKVDDRGVLEEISLYRLTPTDIELSKYK